MSESPVTNVDDVEERERFAGDGWGAKWRQLTPFMRPNGGKLGVNWMCVAPGRAAVPFHAHRLEDEVFYVLSGRGVLRYGDDLQALRPGDCVSCPAGTGVAHQIANPYDEDLVYLSIGNYEPEEVCTYPDSGKVLVRALQSVGRLEKTEYMDGEETPRIFALIDER